MTSNLDHLQKTHHDHIAAEYEKHYDDVYSSKYRQKFMYEPMLKGIDLKGKNVLEAMCGSGQTTAFLLQRGAHVTGIDISSEMIKLFEARWPRCDTICSSFFENGIDDNSFDCIVIIGGLHHLQPRVDEAITEAHRVLKPGGHLCFVEPNARSLANIFRRVWMKFDPLFEENERALHIPALEKKHAKKFEFAPTAYGGQIAYLLVMNSMIFRIPLSLKPIISPPLLAIESCFRFLQLSLLSCYVICRWKKK